MGAGCRISGEQSDVTVTAPAALAPFAQLEEQRVETGLFPILIGRDGLIDPAPTPPMNQQLDRAIAIATRRFRKAALPLSDARRGVAFLSALERSVAEHISQVPRDLFFPRDATRTHDRAVHLPDGTQGHVLVDFKAATFGETRLLKHAARTITTSIGTDARTSHEEWSLHHLG